ncbi:hypothetical protein NQ176_g3450 [Zarea fungicola]|uniref:Uncharacterized protein n=1 Tax=Zarea fungicola TaxID=93591 RepID=A0ACC1NJL2_9HYPO|nr:hypothetical protein NQ176_g3450 [Lecanicillium fungicola]
MNEKSECLGEPLLYPCRLSHTRRHPPETKYSYSYDYFQVGIPVGLRGRIGNLLSIDNASNNEGLFQKCSFTIDPKYYLDRGGGDLGLREKMNIFLRSVNVDPEEFPHAYLLSVPRFMGWQKSAISYWYLYNTSKALGAMIIEVNNSFWEKINIFTRLEKVDSGMTSPQTSAEINATVANYSFKSTQIRFHSSEAKARKYKSFWMKNTFASPFEKVEGSLRVSYEDPLRLAAVNATNALQSTMQSEGTDGIVRLVSRLYSATPPIKALTGSSWDVARCLVRYSHVTLLSNYRILKQAIIIRFKTKRTYYTRPEVPKEAIPRNETGIEK